MGPESGKTALTGPSPQRWLEVLLEGSKEEAPPVDYRLLMSEAIAAELQLRLPERVTALAKWGYIYVFLEPPGVPAVHHRQFISIFWPDGVSVNTEGHTTGCEYFYYCDPAFPENYIRHLLECARQVLAAMSAAAARR